MIAPITNTATSNLTGAVTPGAAATENKSPITAKKDQVEISKLAQKLATDGDTQAQEIRESGAEKASETSRGKA